METTILDVGQMKMIKEEVGKMKDAAIKGLPGMLLGQIGAGGVMNVGFVSHSDSLKIQKIFGTNVGKSGVI